jgi:hypothetical protein
MKDLVVLVADKDAEQTLNTLLGARQQSLGIRPIHYDIFVHPERDGGVRSRCAEFLRPHTNGYRYALVVFDYEGCGASNPVNQLEADLESKLSVSGWQDRASVIIIEPELENWVFSPSPEVASIIADGKQEIYSKHLSSAAFTPQGKPVHPKELMQAIMREARVQRSSALFSELAKKVSLRGCQDPAFQKLLRVLQSWFPRD